MSEREDNVRVLKPVASPQGDSLVETIASGLENIAKSVRAGGFNFPVEGCHIVLFGMSQKSIDDFGYAYLGKEISEWTAIGLFEEVKAAISEDARE